MTHPGIVLVPSNGALSSFQLVELATHSTTRCKRMDRFVPFTTHSWISNSYHGMKIQPFHSSSKHMMVESHTDTSSTTDTVQITYIDSLGNEKTVNAPIGKNLLDIAHDNNIELEGACGGELACATCHLIFEKHIYDILPEKEPEEDDMLDLAMELTDTSRLGCQIKVTKEMDQMKVRIPDDGY